MPVTPLPTPTTSVEQKSASRITGTGSKLVLLPNQPFGKPINLLTPSDSDRGNADRLIARHGHELKYCPDFKRWLAWDGRRWSIRDRSFAIDKACETMQAYQILANAEGLTEKANFAKQSQNAGPCINCLTMAENRLSVASSSLDTHPNMLNFTNGMVALSHGILYPHDPALFITKLIHHPYNPNASCPTFLSFLSQILPSSPEFQSFLFRAFGYWLTGFTRERCVFFCVGTGSNGKSTLLSLLQTILAEYSCSIKISSLSDSSESAARSSDLSDLRGVRFARASEGSKDEYVNEGIFKSLTQGTGGRIKAKRMHQDHHEFIETHKLVIDTNHLPKFKSGDSDDQNNQAIWGRIHLLPFDKHFTEEQQDLTLPDRLAEEAPGILAALVDGAADYCQNGLGPIPDEVRRAGKRWRTKSDPLNSFLKTTDRCRSVAAGEFYQAYRAHTESEGGKPMSPQEFSRRVSVLHGVTWEKRKKNNVFKGISLQRGSGPVGMTAYEQTDNGDDDED